MNRRQLAFIVLVNSLISVVIALAVVWIFEIRRPEAEELAALYSGRPDAVLAATPAPAEPAVAAVAADPASQSDTQVQVSQPAATAQESDSEVYVVRGGDSLVAIAARYGVSVDDIVRINNLTNPDFVFSGQRLLIPVAGPVNSGDGTPTPMVIQGVEISAIEGAGALETETAQVINDSDQAFTLQGWQLVRSDGPSYTFSNVPLFPGGSVRVHTRAGNDTSVDLYWGQAEAQWRSGEVAQLLDQRGSVIHTYTVP